MPTVVCTMVYCFIWLSQQTRTLSATRSHCTEQTNYNSEH